MKKSASVVLTVVDENGLAVSDAQVTLLEPGLAPFQLHTDYAGHCTYLLHQDAPYQLRIEKPGFYQALQSRIDADQPSVEVTLTHEQVIRQEVRVVASNVGIVICFRSRHMNLTR